MKKYIYFLLALCISAVVCSCSKKENEEQKGSEPVKYVVEAKLHSNSENTLEEYNKIVAAMKANGFDICSRVDITSSDKAGMISNIKEVAKKIKADAGSITGSFYLDFTGVEAEYADKNDKNHPWEVFDELHIGKYGNDNNTPLGYNFTVCNWIGEPEGWVDAWVYKLTTIGFFELVGDNNYYCNNDLNYRAGGSYIYPLMETDGKGVWSAGHASRYITDVIAVYGGDAPSSMVVNGRTYKKECNKDLNEGAGGAYIWFYATRDYYDGRYLWIGGNGDVGNSGNMGCSLWYHWDYSSKNFNASEYAHDPWNANGYDIVERVVPAYDSHGVYQGEAEFNHGAGGAYIKLIFAYRKH